MQSCHEDSKVYFDDSVMSYEERDSSLCSRESRVPNIFEEWLKFAWQSNAENKAAF